MPFAATSSSADPALLARNARRTRSTNQQRSIERVLLTTKRPLSVLEIHAEASQKVPSLGIATIYRAVAELQERGTVRQVLLPRDGPRFEPAHLAQHEYFRCVTCNRVYWIFSSPPGLANMVPEGFFMESHQVVLYGTCAACRR